MTDWDEDWNSCGETAATNSTQAQSFTQQSQQMFYDRNDENVLATNINPRDVGIIIGRGGSKIRELEQEFGVRIQLNKQTGEVRVSGNQDNSQSCISRISQMMISGGDRPTSGFRNTGYGQDMHSRGSESQHSFTSGGSNSMTIPIQQQDIGLIIGRGGAKIQELQRSSGARIDIQKNNLVAVISGDDQSCKRAIELIKETVESRTSSGFNNRSNSNNYSNNYGQDYNNQHSYRGSNYRGNNDFNTRSSSAMVETGWETNECDWDAGTFSRKNEDYAPPSKRSNDAFDNRENQQGSWLDGGDGNNDDGFFSAKPPTSNHYNNDAPIDWGACLKESEEAAAKRWAHLPPVIKDFYREDPEIAALLPEEVAEFREQSNNITVVNVDDTDDPLPNPVKTFEQAFSDYPEILDEIRRNKFVNPSPIQSQAWPLLMSGRDTIAIAQTGTGKTLAFLLPAFIHIEGQVKPRSERKGPSVICLCPTRELAQQIYTEVMKYNYHGIKAVCVYGGKGRREQIQACQQGVEIVIATPGRLNDLIMNGIISLDDVTYLILDEADRMLDMGFEPDIRKVLLDVRPDRQSVMTSATWPPGVRTMARRYLKNPAQIYVGTLDLNAVHSVRQELRFIDEENKRAALFDFVGHDLKPDEKLLVFCGRKSTASDVASDLSRNDIPCESIHGDRDQQDRENALADFKESVIRILIATDVASRGLDVADITHVLNYDFPKDMEEYVHRVGRTGRAGRSGVAISFLTRQDWSKAPELIKILEDANQVCLNCKK